MSNCGWLHPYLVCLAGRSLRVSVSESMVMEVVSPAVSGREVAGNCMRMVYTLSALQSASYNKVYFLLQYRNAFQWKNGSFSV